MKKQLLLISFIIMSIFACKKDETKPETENPTTNIIDPTGMYILTNTTYKGEKDTVWVWKSSHRTYMTNPSSLGQDTVEIIMTDSNFVMNKHFCKAYQTFYVKGTGYFSGIKLIHNWTSDRNDDSPQFHNSYNSIYIRK